MKKIEVKDSNSNFSFNILNEVAKDEWIFKAIIYRLLWADVKDFCLINPGSDTSKPFDDVSCFTSSLANWNKTEFNGSEE